MLKILLCFLLLGFNFANAYDLKMIKSKNFISENSSNERKTIVDSLISQFESKREKGVTQADLNKLWDNKKLREKYMMARFQIVNQKVYAESFYLGHYYFPTLLQYFQKLVQTYKVPDVDFIIYLREEIPMNEDLGKETMGVPAFIMFQDKDSIYEMDKLIFPDAFFMKENKNSSWIKLLKKIEKARGANPWETKVNKIFWRGATTGDFYPYTIANFDKLPRLTASVLSKLYPDLIDSEFSIYTPQMFYDHYENNLKEFCEILFRKKAVGVSEEKHLKYKYLLSLDGNAATGTRVPWIMYSNSVLIKQESTKTQWYYSALKPYIHYVPLEHRLTDIFKQIQWMKGHDIELQQISINAQNFVKNNLMPEHIDAHIIILLNEYSTISKDQNIIPTLKPAEEVISIPSVIKMFSYKVKKYFIERVDTWF